MAPVLVLARHGQSEGNLAGALLGRLDSPLTELGELQARATGRALSAGGLHPDLILSSPLGRARRSAELIRAELVASAGDGVADIVVEPRIVEVDYGELEGTRLLDLDPAVRTEWRADPHYRPRGGETLAEVQDRVEAWCDELVRLAPECVLAVTHVSPIKAAAIWALSEGPGLAWRMSLSISTISRVSLSPRSLVSFGESGHLAGLG